MIPSSPDSENVNYHTWDGPSAAWTLHVRTLIWSGFSTDNSIHLHYNTRFHRRRPLGRVDQVEQGATSFGRQLVVAFIDENIARSAFEVHLEHPVEKLYRRRQSIEYL